MRRGCDEACPQEVSAEAVALELWVELEPQGATDVRVPPGFSLAGLRSFLVFDGPEPLSAENRDFGVTISIEAEPEFLVDWGDGSAPVRHPLRPRRIVGRRRAA